MEPFGNPQEHLLAELARLELILQRQVLRLREADLLTEDQFRGLYIPDSQIDALLRDRAEPARREDPRNIQHLTAIIQQRAADDAARADLTEHQGAQLPLLRLVERFALERFERDALLLAVAPEIDLGYQTLFAYVQNDVTKKQPSVDLVLRLLCHTANERLNYRAAFGPRGVLVYQGLLALIADPADPDPPLTGRFLKAEPRVVEFLLGSREPDAYLMPFTQRWLRETSLADLPLPEELKARLADLSRAPASERDIYLFHGSYGSGKQAAAAALCAARKLGLLVVDIRSALASEVPWSRIVDLLRRESLLQDVGVYLSHADALLADETPTAQARLATLPNITAPGLPLFLGSAVAWYPANGLWPGARVLSLDFPLPAFALRRQLWSDALVAGKHALDPDVDLVVLANQYILSGGQIRDAARVAGQRVALRPECEQSLRQADLVSAARDQSNQGLRRLAQKVRTLYDWSDIVLPPRALQALRDVSVSVRYRHVVYGDWGFDQRLALGKGLNVLFAGPSGTGKTMAASVLARDLSLDLYKIDLANVVSKYIGETEQNLSRIFAEAQASNAILFFDEADALFGKRSEIKDAHDRYANIEVAYLLQKMEEYEGIVILATNLSKNLDEAFARRMHHTIEFPFPDAAYRERIWRGMLPDAVPRGDDINLAFLARQFELAGGNIRNIAVAAAFLAAAADQPVSMPHLILATAREFQKLGKLPAQSDFGPYHELIRERG